MRVPVGNKLIELPEPASLPGNVFKEGYLPVLGHSEAVGIARHLHPVAEDEDGSLLIVRRTLDGLFDSRTLSELRVRDTAGELGEIATVTTLHEHPEAAAEADIFAQIPEELREQARAYQWQGPNEEQMEMQTPFIEATGLYAAATILYHDAPYSARLVA